MRTAQKPTVVEARPARPAAPPSRRFGGLDGLRALAVVVVIGFHFIPGAVRGGFVGVDVFFVISGFLITSLLVREHDESGGIALRRFWARRARRLIPALVIVVSVCGAAALAVGGDVVVHLGRQVLGAATFSSNWLSIAFGTSYFDDTTPELFRNLWSLAVEEQFYLLWPLVLLACLLVRSRRVRVALVATVGALSALAMALLTTDDATRVYYGTDTHSFGLAFGACLALATGSRVLNAPVAARVLPWIGALALAGIVAIALVMPAASSFTTRGGLVIVAVLTVLTIAGSTSSGSWLGRVLDTRIPRWVGERSYGLYLWHWPVLVLVLAAVPIGAAGWIAPSIALLLTVTAAALSYRFVEMPIRAEGIRRFLRLDVARGRVRLPRARALTAAVLVAVCAVATGVAIVSDPGKGSAELAIERGQEQLAAAAAMRAPKGAASPDHPAPPPALPSGDQIYAIGDSVMLAAAPELQAKFPGIAIDAEVSRPMQAGPAIVQSIVDAGALRPILVVGLGTNGQVDPADLAAIERIAGPKTLLVVVNAQAPRDWIPGVNAILADFARRERRVELANWHDSIAPRISELADDEVHPGGPISGGIYVDSIVNALQRLAELPPTLLGNQYGLANRPR